MTRALIALVVPLLWALQAPAAESDSAKTLSGAWQTKDSSAHAWTFEQTDKGLHVTEAENGKTIADYMCNTSGRDCDVKLAGRDAKVSFWYNGPKLVEMVTEGSRVVKRRYAPSADGTTLEVEIIPVVPEGHSENIELVRKGGDVRTAQQH